MDLCKSCGDKNAFLDKLCHYCRKGPYTISSYHHHTKITMCRDKCYSSSCGTCGSTNICFDSSATEWGFELYGIVSTITGKYVCKRCPIPRKCKTCLKIFPSGNELFRHLRALHHEK